MDPKARKKRSKLKKFRDIQMELKRWKIMDKIFLISLALMVIFAYVDFKQVETIRNIDSDSSKWDIYWAGQQPATLMMWTIVLIAIGIIWFLIKQDLSEAVALAVTPLILLYTGVQDIIYFVFDKGSFAQSLCWADKIPTVRIISDWFGEACPSQLAFYLSAVIGIIAAYYTYKFFKTRKW